jgi:hypothetical protein
MAEKNSFANLTEENDKLYKKKSIKQFFYPAAYEFIKQGKNMRKAIIISMFVQFLVTFYLLMNMTKWITFNSWLLSPVKLLLTYTNTDFIYNDHKTGSLQVGITIVLALYFMLSLTLLFSLSYFKPNPKRYVYLYKYFGLNLIAIMPVMSSWANIGFVDQIMCEGRASISDCLGNPYVYSWGFAIGGFFYQQILNIMVWSFLYIDSEVLDYSLNGRSKFVAIVSELERVLITLFSVSSSINQYQEGLMALVVVFFVLKLFMRLRHFQYYDYRLSQYCLFLDTMLLSMALMNILINFDRFSMSQESIFLGFCLAGAISAFYAVDFYVKFMVGRFRWSDEPSIDRKTFRRQISNFVMLLNIYKTNTQMRISLWNFVHQHKTGCARQICVCLDIPLVHITCGLGQYFVNKKLYEFLASRIVLYIENQEMRMDLQLTCSMILLLKLKRFNTVTLMMKQVKGLKATVSQFYQVFILE